MMVGGAAAVEAFASGLTIELRDLVAGVRDAAALRRAVAAGAAAAEAFCGERPIACGPGCPHCCVLNVAVLLPEALRIADWLQERLGPEESVRLRARLAAHSSRVRWMEDAERIFQRAACPFLDRAGSCSIHPVRPLVCRGAASIDRESCRTAFAPLTAEEERQVSADLPRQAVYDAAFMALAEALRQQGLDDHSIEVGTGVLAFLEHPEYRSLLASGGRLPHHLWE